jgi:hypothetical protein
MAGRCDPRGPVAPAPEPAEAAAALGADRPASHARAALGDGAVNATPKAQPGRGPSEWSQAGGRAKRRHDGYAAARSAVLLSTRRKPEPRSVISAGARSRCGSPSTTSTRVAGFGLIEQPAVETSLLAFLELAGRREPVEDRRELDEHRGHEVFEGACCLEPAEALRVVACVADQLLRDVACFVVGHV